MSRNGRFSTDIRNMQFKNPEFLWALFFLLIPLIIHLFRFRRFKTEFFTNVKFLQEITQKSRRSSQLKKWLVLGARLLALGALILAFAQPYRSHDATYWKPDKTIIYIDNSLSMQQRGERGELLKEAVQEVVQAVPEDRLVTVMTNDRVYREAPLGELKNELLKINYSIASDDFNTILLKAKNLYSKTRQKRNQLIVISDFQKKNFDTPIKADSTLQLHFIRLKARETPNISVDSLRIENTDAQTTNLTAFLSSSQEVSQSIPVDVYNETDLFAKNTAHFEGTESAEVRFSLPRDQEIKKGRLRIADKQLRFDNTYYFTLQQNRQIRVLSLSEHADNQDFIRKIFGREMFEVEQQQLDNLNYTSFGEADFIILNELRRLPSGISTILKNHLDDGGTIAIIPGAKADIENYNQLLLHLGLGGYEEFRVQPVKISEINFSHPLYTGVFEDQVENFQYPEVNGYYPYRHGVSILSFNNGDVFLSGQGTVYLFTTPLNNKTTNFKQSPLIVPTFYNMGLQSSKLPQLAYTIGRRQKVDIKVTLRGDEVIHLKKGDEDIIPAQRRFNAKVELDLSRAPEEAGLYSMEARGENLGVLAFNASRTESDLRFQDFRSEKSVHLSSDLKQLIETEEYKQNEDSYWKWFVTFALVFALGEFLLLRYLK